MSMPQKLSVAVICGKSNLLAENNFGGEIASAVSAVLKGKDEENIVAPRFHPAAFGKCRLSLVQFGISNGYRISNDPAYPRLLNPKEINIWLALDEEGVELAQQRIEQDGVSSNEFYRNAFPETVMRCGFSVPDPPVEPDFQDWFDFLVEKFEPWKQRFWKEFYESS